MTIDPDLAAWGISEFWKRASSRKPTSIATVDRLSAALVTRLMARAQVYARQHELPVVAGAWRISQREPAPPHIAERWLLVTTQRLCWGVDDSMKELPLENILACLDASLDNPGMIRHGFNAVKKLRLLHRDGSIHFLPVKGGVGACGLTNFLARFARRRDNMIAGQTG